MKYCPVDEVRYCGDPSEQSQGHMLYLSAFSIALQSPRHIALAGYGPGPPRVSTTIGAPLEANGVVLSGQTGPIVLVSIDCLFASDDLTDQIKRFVQDSGGCNLESLLVVASHTHYAPALDRHKPLVGMVDEAYFDAVVDAVGRKIVDALAQPAADPTRWVAGHSKCDHNVRRRRRRSWPQLILTGSRVAFAPEKKALVRHDVDIIAVYDAEGLAMLCWTWPCHAVNEPNPLCLSSDFPGRVRERLRSAFGDADIPILFLPGFAGDQRPCNVTSSRSVRDLTLSGFGPTFAANTDAYIAELTDDLSGSIQDALATAKSMKVETSGQVGSATVPLSGLLVGFDETTSVLPPLGVHYLRSDELNMLFVGAEVCEPYYEIVQDLVPSNTMMTGYTGQVFGYLPSDAQCSEGGYEVDGFLELFALSGKLRSCLERPITDAVRRAVGLATKMP